MLVLGVCLVILALLSGLGLQLGLTLKLLLFTPASELLLEVLLGLLLLRGGVMDERQQNKEKLERAV